MVTFSRLELLLGILGVCVCLPGFQILTLFKTKKKAIFHTRFQIWPLRNYVIITSVISSIRTRTKRFLKIHFEFAHFSFFLIDFSGIETINTLTHFPVASTKTMKFKIPANQALV